MSDLKTSKSGWIYHQNKRILLLTHEHKEDKKADTDKSEKKGTEKISRDLAVKAVQALKAKKVTDAGFYLSDHFNLEHFLTSSKFWILSYPEKFLMYIINSFSSSPFTNGL